MISTRDNSNYKWQDKGVLGALEIPSQPNLELNGEYIPRCAPGKEALFDQALTLWNERKWREGFIEACENIPKATWCCGLLPDDDQTIRDMQGKLNKGWIKAMNQILRAERKDFMMDVFIWQWHNATGKSLTLILLVRFLQSPRNAMLSGNDEDVSPQELRSSHSDDKVPRKIPDENTNGHETDEEAR